ncbi:MAG TPA: helix-turn-helix domain-containing protein, partial [Nitriliruptoraceae bacterium]|nr:helix-turn-helix domain-containing protein [Nitriliruptoraceae bacterium]
MPTNEVPAVARALRLMETLAAAPHGLAAGELEQVDDGSRSGMYALLSTLRSREWLVQDDQGRYLVGPAIRRLVPDADDDEATAVDAFHAVVDGDDQDETVILAVPDVDGPRVVARVLADRVVHASFRVGDHLAPTSAPAMVLDAELDPTLDEVRAAGLAVASDDDVVEVAAPVCRDDHHPDAVVGIAIPRQRATPAVLEATRHHARAVAADMSRRLGASTWRPWGAETTPIGAARELRGSEVHDLMTGRLGAQLACLTDSGTPHVVPLWFEYDGDHVWLAASPGSSWARYVADGAPVSLTIEE